MAPVDQIEWDAQRLVGTKCRSRFSGAAGSFTCLRDCDLSYQQRGFHMEESLLDGKRVLIVDDEPDVLATLEELLPMCNVVKAASFEEAKELLTTQYFDMAILDIMGVDGYKLLEIGNKR